ncbi:hypothetical protein [Pelagovum pacificum]|uniref:Uncharacterized protein n=1 Tax=Pelagovum pacificum TaxID=2588711 RepID=A0A5C5GCB8_9RHOB|nr:hypothetical protein [Pelagovum pacificum]QQA41403.1 hypothetical protein I8N54_11235 [Pelagovum pacificum]TNY31794.1 hypothetical protein FHY64_00370 [Pelagovum pacificum]
MTRKLFATLAIGMLGFSASSEESFDVAFAGPPEQMLEELSTTGELGKPFGLWSHDAAAITRHPPLDVTAINLGAEPLINGDALGLSNLAGSLEALDKVIAAR